MSRRPDAPSRYVRAILSSLVIGGMFASVVPATATHGGIHPSFRTESVYFHCEGDVKVQNTTLPAPWNTTAPTSSVQQGAGCGAVDPAFLINTPQSKITDASFSGTFAGNIRDLSVELWILGQGANTVQTAQVTAEITLVVEGETLIDKVAKSVPLVASSSGASRVARFTIADLGCAQDVLDAQGNVVGVRTDGLVTEDGNGTTPREIYLGVGTGGTVGTFVMLRLEILAWVWDTTEVPSGITFNPAVPAPTTIKPADPASCD